MIGEKLTVLRLDVAMYDFLPACYRFFCRRPMCMVAESRSKTMKNMPDHSLGNSHTAVETFSLADFVQGKIQLTSAYNDISRIQIKYHVGNIRIVSCSSRDPNLPPSR